jgi:hypothetical protein
VRIVADGTVFRRRLVQGAVAPEGGHLAMTFEAEGGLRFSDIAGMRRAMSAMTGNAFHLCDGPVLNPVALDFILDIRVTVETNFARLSFDQIGLIGAVVAVALLTFAFGEGGVGGRFRFLADQLLMTGEAEFAAGHADLQQAGLLAAMGTVTI